jgi:hypothetical protein
MRNLTGRDLRREGEREETFVEKGNEKFAKVGLCPSVKFWILNGHARIPL